MTPRLLIAAPCSGEGKTTVTCALLRAFQNRGLRMMACKSGPDYIDPMFHERVIGVKGRNLDGFFFDRATLCALLQENSRDCDLTLIEGAMGFYDGIAMGAEASAWSLACRTDTPVVLVVDGRGAALSVAATVQGFLHFRPDSRIAGVILNRVSGMLYPRLADCIRTETGLPVLGYLPPVPESELESRHLGLVTAEEITDLQAKLDRLAEVAERTVDLAALLCLAQTAPPLCAEPPVREPVTAHRPKIALARDRAFCFYYQDGLDLLERLGAELVPFSPLEDEKLPEGISGIYLGGGYPELYARQLSENRSLRAELAGAIAGGMPCIAECGGFLYLHKTMEDRDGQPWPMLGVVEARAYRTERLGRFGYITLTAERDGLLLAKGESIPAHEFHYWDSEQPGTDFRAEKPQSTRGWTAGISTETLYAGFPHIHFCARPQTAARFVCACDAYRRRSPL